ncbi:MAG: alpha/beta hydrolase, partial [Bacteroidales bacterium]|nr:alpha/beta hydrolase [Bacteroidales bacterium]
LQRADPEGYIHETHIVQGKPHWMDHVDTVAVSWMAQYRRNPYPKKIVWRQEEVLHQQFYWLSAPEKELARGKTVRLEVKKNTIDITQCDYSSLTLLLNDELVNLDKKVTVLYNGRTLFRGKLQRTAGTMKATLHQRGDLRYMFPSSVTVSIP